MPAAPGLSASAVALFRLHVERKGDLAVDDATRGPYREPTEAGLMVVGHNFAGGRESFYALTEAGRKFARVLERNPFTSPSPAESASPRR